MIVHEFVLIKKTHQHMEFLGELHSLNPQNQKEILEAGENERKASDHYVVERLLVERPWLAVLNGLRGWWL